MQQIARGACLGTFLGALHGSPSAYSFWTGLGLPGPVPLLLLAASLAALALVFRGWRDAATLAGRVLFMAVTGFAYYLTALYWLGEAFVEPGQFYSIRAALGLFSSMWLFFPWWALGSAAAHLLAGKDRGMVAALALAGGLSLGLLALDDLIYGIPLAPFALSALDTPLAGLASWIGQGGLTAFLLVAGFGLGVAPLRPRLGALTALTALLAILPAAQSPMIREPDHETLVALVQPGDAFFDHVTPEQATADLLQLAAEGFAKGAALVVLPENSLPFDLGEKAHPLATRVLDSVPPNRFLLVGYTSIAADPNDPAAFRPFNTLALISGYGQIEAVQTKAHLVPFGEYMPQLFHALGFDVLAGPPGGFGAGPSLGVMSVPGLPPVAPVICYESILSGAISRETTGAAWLLNPTSERMFGQTFASRQLLDYARLRAVETGLPVLRAASTGMTAHVDADGQVLAALPRSKRGVLLTRLSAASPTPFRDWGQGPYLAMLAALVAALSVRRIIRGCSRAAREMEFSEARRF